jgi:hypothetical protein
MNIAQQGSILLTRAQSDKKRARRHNFFVYSVLKELLIKAWYKTNNCTRKTAYSTRKSTNRRFHL